MTALHYTAEMGRYDEAVALLNWGAEVDAVTRVSQLCGVPV